MFQCLSMMALDFSMTILVFNRQIAENYLSNKESFFEHYEVVKYGRGRSDLS